MSVIDWQPIWTVQVVAKMAMAVNLNGKVTFPTSEYPICRRTVLVL
jgi:hypothetical protein